MSNRFRYSARPRFTGAEMPPMAEVEANHQTGVYETADRHGTAQRLGVRITALAGVETTIIRPMPATDEVGRIQLADDQGVYRSLSGASIIGVDYPGMGDGTTSATETQRHRLGWGRFDEIGHAQWEAIDTALKQQNSSLRRLGRVVLWGSSFGSNQVAGLWAAKPEEVEVTDIVLQMTPWRTRLPSLAWGFAEAARGRDYYYELDGENYHGRESDQQWRRRIATRRKIGALLSSAFVMSKGGIMADLTDRPLKSMRVHIMNAEFDRISPTDHNQSAHSVLHEAGAHVEYELMQGEYHAIQQSRRVVGIQARDIVGA